MGGTPFWYFHVAFGGGAVKHNLPRLGFGNL
jgi:hypothetical protein